MLRLETFRLYLWRNAYADHPVLVGTVRFGEALGWTTDRLSPASLSIFEEHLPGLLRGSRSLDATEFLARLAQQIQLVADIAEPACGVVSCDTVKREAVLFFSCLDTFIAPRCLSLAVQIMNHLTETDVSSERLAKMLKSCADLLESNGLEHRTRVMIEAAIHRGIPWTRVSPLVRHVQLGHGARQQRFWNTVFSSENGFGRDYSRNKLLTLDLLERIGLPVGRVELVKDGESALRVAKAIGYPLVLKPVDGMQGESVYVDLRDEAELRAALVAGRANERQYILQSFFPGNDHRLLVVSGKLVAAARKIPASVTGDGRSSIAELVESENNDPRRISGQTMSLLTLKPESDRILARQGYSRESIPDAGCVVYIAGTSNISTGGTSVDVMGIIHPDNASAAVRAAGAVGLTIAGVDFISPDISKSWHDVGGGICEVNTVIGLRPHYLATPDFDVRGKIIEAFYPPGDDGRIPTAMITGTMGKTTTTLMLASILASAGHTVGSATTESVKIGGRTAARGDLAGADGASMVLRDPTATAAVLETSRGGIIKTGMYLDRCDVSALLNVDREQIGMDGIETLDDMAALKRKVLDAARKAVVLNADDPRCLALAPEFERSLRVFLFSRHSDSPALRSHLSRGGDALFLVDQNGRETIMIASGSTTTPLLRTAEVPATCGGLFWQHSSNAMAAASLALGLGIDLDTIRLGLRRYGGEFPAATCRLFIAEDFPVRTMFDYAAQAPGFVSVSSVTDKISVKGKRFCATTLAGNRPDWQYAESAAALAGHFDRFVLYEVEEYRRGRKPGEIAARLKQALAEAGVDDSAVSVVGCHEEVARLIAAEATAEDFVLICGGVASQDIVDQYRAAFRGVRLGA